jgi:hypothetical protein
MQGYVNQPSVLTGDAVIGDVLTAKKFYKDDPNTQLTGTMPNNSGDVAAISSHTGAAGEIHIVPAAGYTDGSDDASVITDSDFIAGNIIHGKNIFGIDGTVPINGTLSFTGTYANSTYYTSANCYVGRNADLLFIIVRSGTTTSYENIYFVKTSAPAGVALVGQSYYSYASTPAQSYYISVWSGCSAHVNVSCSMETRNATPDTIQLDVTISDA